MYVSSRAAALKLVQAASISKLAVYSSAIIPGVILGVCSCVQVVLSWSGSLKVLSINAKSSARVPKEDMLSKMVLFSLAAHTWAIPPCMKDRVYRIFILSSAKALSCIVMAIQMDWTNCSMLSQLPSKGSGLDALAFLVGWPLADVCMLVRMVWATANAAWEAVLATSGASITRVCKSLLVAWSCVTS